MGLTGPAMGWRDPRTKLGVAALERRKISEQAIQQTTPNHRDPNGGVKAPPAAREPPRPFLRHRQIFRVPPADASGSGR